MSGRTPAMADYLEIKGLFLYIYDSQVAQMVKRLSTMWETWV